MTKGNGVAEPVSLKQERTCERCKRPFWAWDDKTRTHCYICNPPPWREVQRFLKQL